MKLLEDKISIKKNIMNAKFSLFEITKNRSDNRYTIKGNISEYAVNKKFIALAYTATLYFYERIYVLEVEKAKLLVQIEQLTQQVNQFQQSLAIRYKQFLV